MSSSSAITTSQVEVQKWLHINAVAVIQSLKWLRMIWTEQEEKLENEICEIANCISSPHFTVSFPHSLSLHMICECFGAILRSQWWRHLAWQDDYTFVSMRGSQITRINGTKMTFVAHFGHFNPPCCTLFASFDILSLIQISMTWIMIIGINSR